MQQYNKTVQKMINFDEVTKKHKRAKSKLAANPDHPYRLLIIGGSGSGKTNLLFNLISYQPNTDKICLYVKDPYKAKFQLLINKRKTTGLKYPNNFKHFIKYLNDVNDICKNIKVC